MRARLNSYLTVSQEQVSTDGVEREYVFYGKMVDPSDLKEASGFEEQEQWRVHAKSDTKNRKTTVRIRKTTAYTKDGEAKDPVYTLTVKSFKEGTRGCVEAESVLPEVEGKKLLSIFRADGDGMIKRRYFFKAKGAPDGCQWEVDVFKGQRGKGCWVKLDLEVPSFSLKLSDTAFELPFPISLEEVIYQQAGKRDKATEAKIRDFMDKLLTA